MAEEEGEDGSMYLKRTLNTHEICTFCNTSFHHNVQLLVKFRPAPTHLILGEEEDHSFNPIKSHMWRWHGGE